MDCRYPYGRGATVDKNREIAGSRNQAIPGDAGKRALGTGRLLGPLNVRRELYRMRVTIKNPMTGIAMKIRMARSRVGRYHLAAPHRLAGARTLVCVVP
jgi:hypothetical protein